LPHARESRCGGLSEFDLQEHVVSVPILLVGGFLGAGKTTIINHLLSQANGSRVAAIVNDFGAINIDADLIAGSVDGVVSLSNGCICCSLDGDLLRTIALLLRRDPRPERIIIETSGVADPRDVVRGLMDPVIWREAPLETVLCVVDATSSPTQLEDDLISSQLRAADIVALSKIDLVDRETAALLRNSVLKAHPAAVVVDAPHGKVSPTLLFLDDPDRDPVRREVRPRSVKIERFETTSWSSELPLSLPLFQQAIDRLAPRLARAKGLIETVERPGSLLLFQLAGRRATLSSSAAPRNGATSARMVFISELGVISAREIEEVMDGCILVDSKKIEPLQSVDRCDTR
jgi:G3E family GTPase